MKISISAFIILFQANSVFGQNANKILIGSWTTTKIGATNTLNENWSFQSVHKGVWNRNLIMTDSVIVCQIQNPFTWTLTNNTKLRVRLGKTACICKARESRFEKGLDGFIKDYKASFDNGSFSYTLKLVDNDAIKLDERKLVRKKN